MSGTCPVRIVTHGTEKWGDLGALVGRKVEVVAEQCSIHDANYSFKGQHRVRLIYLRDKVHFKIPQGTNLDISAVPAMEVPKTPATQRHDKRRNR